MSCLLAWVRVQRFSGTEVRSVDDQWNALQALSDAHTFLFEERQRLLTLQAENDELRLQVRLDG